MVKLFGCKIETLDGERSYEVEMTVVAPNLVDAEHYFQETFKQDYNRETCYDWRMDGEVAHRLTPAYQIHRLYTSDTDGNTVVVWLSSEPADMD